MVSPDPRRPTVCFDETSTQLIAERRIPIPAHRGRRERFDYEYRRNGTRNLFMLCEPPAGLEACGGHRATEDGGLCLPDAVAGGRGLHQGGEDFVLDNLNTHRPASLYQTFAPVEARRILKRLEFHYTPKHGSWLNMAEIELSVLSRQCLGRRIPRRGDAASGGRGSSASAMTPMPPSRGVLPLQLHGPLCATCILPRKIIWTNY